MPNEIKPFWKLLLVPLFVLTCIFYFLGDGILGLAQGKKVPSPCQVSHRSDMLLKWECRRLRPGQTIEGLFGERWQDVARFNRIDRRHANQGVYLKVPKQLDDIRGYTPMPRHYQPAESEAKFILVDLSEQFLGAYEYGQLAFSSPVVTGERTNKTPAGEFRITAFSRFHKSSLYCIEKTSTPYPMNYGLRFFVSAGYVSYWIHGRDLPGYAASHGCIGLYDEAMQNKNYGYPKRPELNEARKLYEWVISDLPDDGRFHTMENGPKILITGHAPETGLSSRAETRFMPCDDQARRQEHDESHDEVH